jgi:Zn-dependent protease/predicted transcriptional regulator
MFLHRVKLFTLAGFTVWVDASWLIFAMLIAWTLATGVFPSYVAGAAPATYWWMAVAGTIGLFFSIVLHELSHSLVARRFALPINGITLFIFGGVAELDAEPGSAKAEFLMAVAGPVASMVLGTIALALAALAAALPAPVGGVLSYLGYINWMLALFNLVPAFPLDGGRMLRAALWGWKQDLRWATNIASGAGALFGVLLILGGIFEVVATGNFIGGVWLFLIGMFLHGAAGAARQQMLVRQVFAGHRVADFMNPRPITVEADLSLRRLVDDYFYRHPHKMFPVLGGGRLLGCVTAARVRQSDPAEWERLAVRDILERSTAENTVSSDTDALAALSKMQRAGNSRLLVVDRGALVGILSLKDMLQHLSLRQELGDEGGRRIEQI